MAYPIGDPEWADDTNIATGTEAGTPTKVDPGTGYLSQGFVPGATFVGPYVNFVINRLCAWVLLYLKDLHNQVEFLNKAYTWTATHVFGTGSGAWTITSGSITSPGGNIDTGGQIEGQSFVIDSTSAEVVYKATRNRTNVQLTMSGGQAGPGGGFLNTSDELVQTANAAGERFTIKLPRGSTIRSIEAIYEKDSVASGSTAGYLAAAVWSRDWLGPGPSTFSTSLGQADATASTSPQFLSLTGLSTVVGANDVLVVTVSGLATLSTNSASFHGLRISFDDPGPRNY